MPIHKAEADWHGTFDDGEGEMRLGSGAFEGAYSYRSRLRRRRRCRASRPPLYVSASTTFAPFIYALGTPLARQAPTQLTPTPHKAFRTEELLKTPTFYEVG